ncbi:hypothetical protein Golob_025394, partial [Gossypium lobatum]|nr:hypothetical protein [Gossypium lobatum]
ALGHVDEVVLNLFDRIDKGVIPIPVILAETFRSLNACRRAGEGTFIGCAQLLWCGSIVTFGKWKRKMLNGKLFGWCPTISYIDVGTLTGSLYLEFGELSDMPLCSY